MNGRREMTMEEAQAAYLKRVEKVKHLTNTTISWIVLYNDADAHVTRSEKPHDYTEVLYNIPIHPWHKNKPSRLLFCYDNGHVNVMCPKELFKDKLKSPKRKQDGYKRASCKLMKVFVCDKDDYIVICSRDSKEDSYIKATQLDTRGYYSTMNAQGYIFVKDGTPYRWMIVPKELKEWIQPIIKKNNEIGFPLASYNKLQDLIDFEKWALGLATPPIVGIS